MKKIILFTFMIVGLFLSVFTGCKKDDDPKPDPEPVKFVFDVKPTSDTTAYLGTTVSFDINTNADSIRIFSEDEDTMIYHPGNFRYDYRVNILGKKEIYYRGYLTGFDVKQQNRNVIGVNPPPPPEAPVILLVDSVNIPSGASYNIALVIQNALTVLSDIPGLTGIAGGIYPTGPLTHDTVFHISATNDVGTTVDSIRIFVEPPLSTTRQDSIAYPHAWRVDSLWYKQHEEDSLVYFPPPLNVTNRYIVFYQDWIMKEFELPNIYAGQASYSLSEDGRYLSYSIFQGDLIKEIVDLTDTSMTVKGWIPCSGCENNLTIEVRKYKLYPL
jgi:hypothetical protein